MLLTFFLPLTEQATCAAICEVAKYLLWTVIIIERRQPWLPLADS